ncbi:MAG: PPOX class F420-dependent oxidoreductase [Candidatus Lambdaproteobacteria bacterium]|nr:PPOX class F420-dependent oxidoreductase [Candidatus Lambdaproteobacteria bacterium]
MDADALRELARTPYIALATYRRDGREVVTPVWCATQEGKLWAYSEGKAGKVKRIRASGRVRVAPCTYGGQVTGAWREGTARVVTEPARIAAVYAAFQAKYGWTYRLLTWLAWLGRKIGKRAVLELSV